MIKISCRYTHAKNTLETIGHIKHGRPYSSYPFPFFFICALSGNILGMTFLSTNKDDAESLHGQILENL